MRTDTVQASTATGPVMPETPPIWKRTSAGTPAATKKAPTQLRSRRMLVFSRDAAYSSEYPTRCFGT